MQTNKSSKAVGFTNISSGGLRFAEPVKVKAKRNRAKPNNVSGDAMLLKAESTTQGNEANTVEVSHAA